MLNIRNGSETEFNLQNNIVIRPRVIIILLYWGTRVLFKCDYSMWSGGGGGKKVFKSSHSLPVETLAGFEGGTKNCSNLNFT